MIRSVVLRLLISAALLLGIPSATAAQVAPASPEGVDWHLVGYAVGGEMGMVPWSIDATLRLEDGTAAGYGGCNHFSGGYRLEGESLVFDEALAMTRRACPDQPAAIEDTYLANLSEVAAWAIDEDRLRLSDDEGEARLEFEPAVSALTATDVAALAAELGAQQERIERLEQRLDNVRIGVLRDRIKELEDELRTLRGQVASAAAASSSGSGGGTAFTSAEQTLLRGVPPRIRGTCRPLRGSSLPVGTLAAVRCQPKATVVSEMAYYLMPYGTAERTFVSVMDSHSVPGPGRRDCSFGRPTQMLLSPYNALGCYVDDGSANVRIVTWANSDCRQLEVEGERVREPVVYIALESGQSRIGPLWDWALNPDEDVMGDVWTGIPQSGTPRMPGCRGVSG